MKIALIGYGDWGKNIARNFNEMGCLHAICDIDSEKRFQAKEKYPDASLIEDYNELLNENSIDGVAIATPSYDHYQITKDFLSHGVPVLVEKPVTLNYNDAKNLKELSEKNKVPFMAAHLMEYHPAIEKLKGIVKSEEFGEIKHIRSTRVNLGKIRPDESVWWNFATHDLSIIASLIDDELDNIHAQSFKPLQDKIEDTVYVDLNYKSGKSAHIHLSWLEPIKLHQTLIVFEKALVVFNDTIKDNKLMLYRYAYDKNVPFLNKESEEPLEYGYIEPLKNECTHFIDCIQNNLVPKTDGNKACQIIKIMEDVQKVLDRYPNLQN